MPKIVTITSDFGWKDYYLAILKGAILSKVSEVMLVDITHRRSKTTILSTLPSW